MQVDEAMRRAFALAANGPASGPNPQVGCVILSPEGDVLAEGWHRGAGTAHAEVDALSRCAHPQGATLVVSLEPCNHTGRTGPCSEAILAAGISRVVYAVTDPNPVARGGADRLRSAGLDVTGGVRAAEGTALLGDWLTMARLGRPFITVKWAAGLDGRAAAADGSSRWITGLAARRRVHEERAAHGAIIVGTGTVLADDPALTARRADGSLLPDQPVPVVVGLREVPQDAAVRRHPHPPVFARTRDVREVLGRLRSLGVRTALVEGGPRLASAFIREGLVDRYQVFLAPTILGGPRLAVTDIGVATLAERRALRFTGLERLGDDVLLTAVPVEAQAGGAQERAAGSQSGSAQPAGVRSAGARSGAAQQSAGTRPAASAATATGVGPATRQDG